VTLARGLALSAGRTAANRIAFNLRTASGNHPDGVIPPGASPCPRLRQEQQFSRPADMVHASLTAGSPEKLSESH